MLKSKFDQTFKFCDAYFICKFALLLCEGAYPYKYMNEWDKFEKTSLPLPFQNFYSSLHLEKISKISQRHAKKIQDTFEIENLGHYHHLYLQSDTSLLCNVFRYFAEMYLKIYDIFPCHFYSAPDLLWTAPLKKDQNSVRTINPYQIVLESQKKSWRWNLSCSVLTGKSKQ